MPGRESKKLAGIGQVWAGETLPIPPGEAYYPVWPEHGLVLEVFLALSTQWRILAHMAGSTPMGLEYAAIPPVLEMMGVVKADWPPIFADLRVIERAALDTLRSDD